MLNLLIILSFLPIIVHADTSQDALNARNAAMNALKSFQPGSIIKEYSPNPRQTNLASQSEGQNLSKEAFNQLSNDKVMRDLYQSAQTRERVTPIPQSKELQQAEVLLQHEDSVLKEKLPCMQGECASTQVEESDDIQDGVKELGALSAIASEVSTQQIGSGQQLIFRGDVQTCNEYPIGFRDCCKDSGWGEWVQNCPNALQALVRAKAEERVVYVGHFKKHRLSKVQHVYCIFPTRLATIVQTEGRWNQLGIAYGEPKYPDCRGLTPEELARIDFARLNLSPLVQTFMARMALPNTQSIASQTENKIERLHQEDKAYE